MDKQQKQIELPLDLFDKIQTGTRLFLRNYNALNSIAHFFFIYIYVYIMYVKVLAYLTVNLTVVQYKTCIAEFFSLQINSFHWLGGLIGIGKQLDRLSQSNSRIWDSGPARFLRRKKNNRYWKGLWGFFCFSKKKRDLYRTFL